MHLTVINVEVDRAVWGEEPVCLFESGFDERKEIGEGVGITARSEPHRFVTFTFEAGAVTVTIAHRFHLRARLLFARVERWINVNELDRFARKRFEDGEIVAEVNTVHGEQ